MSKIAISSISRSVCWLLLALASPIFAQTADRADVLTQQRAVALALSQDPFLSASELIEQALTAEGIAQSFRPDPRLSLAAANFPTDTFNFGQEPMTQLMIGVSQVLPRGASLKLRQSQRLQLAAQQPWLRANRLAVVRKTVSMIWLELYRSEGSVALIEADRDLFEQLVDVADLGYSNALARSGQQDLIRAQLEVSAIEDRLSGLRLQADSARQRLAEWVGPMALNTTLSAALPASPIPAPRSPDARSLEAITAQLRKHPALLAMDAAIKAKETAVSLARQSESPEWMLSAQYGLRSNAPGGADRADFLSLAVSVDLPWFRAQRADQRVSAAADRAEAMRFEQALMLRQLAAQWATAQAELTRVEERDRLYRQTLLPQMHELSEAALNAYNNDEGDFAEAVRAQLAELNGKIELLHIEVQVRLIGARLAYLETQVEPGHQGAGHE